MSNILRFLFPVPKDDTCAPPRQGAVCLLAPFSHPSTPGRARSKRVMTFANQADFISFRHHTYEQPRGAKSITLKEARASGMHLMGRGRGGDNIH